MSGQMGMNIKVSIFGESHGKSIGIVVDGMPPGLAIDWDAVQGEMDRRAPGRDRLSTQRKETDMFTIQSGFFEGHTTGTPLCAVIPNSDQHSKDYSILKDKMRPGHADYAAMVHYRGFNDYRGGGHFSGRLTAPLVFVGAIAKQVLAKEGITIGSHILQIENLYDRSFDPMGETAENLLALKSKAFCVIDDSIGEAMKERILSARKEANSVGGVIEAMAINVPAGIGEPYFDSFESRLSYALFSVPAVKGVEFGDGFGLACMTGRQANDPMRYVDNRVLTTSNHNGGITGGITNGMPVVLRVVIKPTPSIAQEQETVSLKEVKNTTLKITGRHDPCILPRAVPVIESVIAWTLWDLLLEAKKWSQS